MCDHCGCDAPDRNHSHAEGHTHGGHGHRHDGAHSHVTIDIEADVLSHNRAHADALRKKMDALNARVVNIIGSPGCGKTGLLTALIPTLDAPAVVVEGDLATSNDAVRIKETGAPVHQIETGTACHLSAHDVAHAVAHLPVAARTLVLIENVGNLVCPSMFDVGEHLRIVCLSVTEGADKPEKYPVSFREADVAVITKSDLLPHVDFDLTHCQRLIADIHPGMPVYVTSAKQGDSLDALRAHLLGLWKA